MRDARHEARRIDDELAGLGGDERARAREIDLLRYQLAEIDAAEITGVHEAEALTADADILADAEAHRDALAAAYETLEGAAEDAVGRAAGELAGRAPFSAIADRLHALQAEIAEAAREVRMALESVVIDPERLAGVQARRALLQELTRKYGPGLAEVLEYRTEIATRLEELETHDARAAALDAAQAAAIAGARRAAADLSALRKKAAGPLAAAVTEQLRDLAMPKATFAVELTAAELSDDGADDVMFVLAPNPGEPPRPLARAASGGELSRAMLALRVVLSEAPPTLVFDEVDAGIGGEAGSAVGRALAGLGGHHQVLCVTHLPQVAAFADAHVAVSKSEQRGRTRATAARAARRRAGRGARADARRRARLGPRPGARARAAWRAPLRCGPRRAPGEAAPARRQ